jgi:hypothetical protein
MQFSEENYYLFWSDDPMFLFFPNLSAGMAYLIATSTEEKANEIFEKLKDHKLFKKFHRILDVPASEIEEYEKQFEKVQNLQLELVLDPPPDIFANFLNNKDIGNIQFAAPKPEMSLPDAIKASFLSGDLKKVWVDQDDNLRYEFTEKGLKEAEKTNKLLRAYNKQMNDLLKNNAVEIIGTEDDGRPIYKFKEPK